MLSFDLLYYDFCFARAISYSLCTGCRDNCIRSSSCLCNILTFPCVCWNSVLSLNKYLAFPWEELQELLPQCSFPAVWVFFIRILGDRNVEELHFFVCLWDFSFPFLRLNRATPDQGSSSLHSPASVFCYLLAKDVQFSGQITNHSFLKGGIG